MSARISILLVMHVLEHTSIRRWGARWAVPFVQRAPWVRCSAQTCARTRTQTHAQACVQTVVTGRCTDKCARIGLCIGSISASPTACPLRGSGHAGAQNLRGGHFEHRHAQIRAADMPSAMPRCLLRACVRTCGQAFPLARPPTDPACIRIRASSPNQEARARQWCLPWIPAPA